VANQLTPISQVIAAGGNSKVRVPKYNRNDLTIGMAHIGVGNFHRAHQIVYLDDLHDQRSDQKSWGSLGIGLMDTKGSLERAIAMQAQNCNYTLTEYNPNGAIETRVLSSILDYCYGPKNPAEVVKRLTDPAIKIVSMTIGEGGYDLDESTGKFMLDAAHISADLKSDTPRSTWGVIVSALAARRKAGIEPFTIVSCDNLRSNGDTAKRATVGYAEGVDSELATWISGNVSFPNSMVDRIAPVIDDTLKSRMNEHSGILDEIPVAGESFKQWVIEDKFPTGRPAWEEVGVQLRPDVAEFESIKGRMLNASHVMMSYPALVIGLKFVYEAARDELINKFILTFMNSDSIPLITPPSDISLPDYQKSILERFSNLALPDTLARVASDGSNKIPVFHRVTTETLIAKNSDTRRVALNIAAYRKYLTGKNEKGESFTPIEPKLTPNDLSLLKSNDPLDAFKAAPFASWQLEKSPKVVADYLSAVKIIDEKGMRAAIEAAIA
jgi:mannitol 2-dehydrogenase/sorbose reductase